MSTGTLRRNCRRDAVWRGRARRDHGCPADRTVKGGILAHSFPANGSGQRPLLRRTLRRLSALRLHPQTLAQWRNHRWEPNGRAAGRQRRRRDRRRLLEAVSMAACAERDSALKWAMRSEGRYSIESTLALADDMTGIRVDTAEWDKDPWLLGVPNGVVDLRTGLLRQGQQEDQITKHAGVAFDRGAKCPRWEHFLREVFDGNAELVSYVRRSIGYTLTGDVREDCWFGSTGGQNGKSTLFKVLLNLFGDYGFKASFSLVIRGHGDKGKRDRLRVQFLPREQSSWYTIARRGVLGWGETKDWS